MPTPRLVDAVIFRHFGAISRLDVLESRLDRYDRPRCAGAVWSELFDATDSDEGCQRVLEAGVLGNPHEIEMRDLHEVFRIRRALSLDETESLEHLGEAESLFLADRLGGTFITDDAAAFAFAEANLGDNRVLDTVDLLREGVAEGDVTANDAKLMADAIRNCGRYLRSGHPWTLTLDYFEIR